MAQEPKYDYVFPGAFCILYGQENGQTYMLVSERGLHFKGKSEGFGTTGGYVDIKDREQPDEGVCREIREELINGDKTPVLTTVTPDRVQIVATGIDYSVGVPGTRYVGNHWDGFKCELNEAEMKILRGYVDRMANDPDFAAAVREASNQEVANVYLLTPQQFQDKILRNEIKFAYAHEQNVALKVAQQLMFPGRQQAPQNKPWG